MDVSEDGPDDDDWENDSGPMEDTQELATALPCTLLDTPNFFIPLQVIFVVHGVFLGGTI